MMIFKRPFRKRYKILFALMIGLAVVSFWRGTWGILDVFIFPENYALSSVVSFAFGVGLLVATNYLVKELM